MENALRFYIGYLNTKNAGGFLPEPQTTGSGERARLLRQIADALNLPLSAFSRRLDPVPDDAGPSTAECAALLAAFSRIRDPLTRRRCLDFLESCTDR